MFKVGDKVVIVVKDASTRPLVEGDVCEIVEIRSDVGYSYVVAHPKLSMKVPEGKMGFMKEELRHFYQPSEEEMLKELM